MVSILYIFVGIVVVYFLAGLRIVNEYERGVKFTLGKYVGLMSPGLRLVLPLIQAWQRVDMRVRTIDVPSQDCISKDNIPLKVNAVLYYCIDGADKAVLKVEYYNYA